LNARTIGADQLFDIFDQNGQALAVGVDTTGAALKVEGLMERLDWTGDIVIRRRSASTTPSPAARLWLVHDGLDQFGPVTVHVRSPFGFFGLTLEQALARIDQFHLQDQHRLRAGIERYFGVGPDQVDHTRRTTTPAPARRATKRTEKESA
jgi:hypothetical protein